MPQLFQIPAGHATDGFIHPGHGSSRAKLDKLKITEQQAALCEAAGQSLYNTSKFTLRDLKSRGSQQQLQQDFLDYLDGFSSNVQDILTNFEFRDRVPRLSKADALGTLINKFLDPDIDLSHRSAALCFRR